jgi:glutathione peroxidase
MPPVLAPFLCLALTAAVPAHRKVHAMSFFDLSTLALDGQPMPFSAFKGKVVLAVNVASECGFTPQYEGLQKLQADFAARGFSVIGFPCNQFGGQEPGTAEAIQTFCSSKFHVTFPMTEKVEVKGPAQSPVFAFLAKGAGEPQWNFHKYLIGKDGAVIKAFSSKVAPGSSEVKEAIEAALKQ